MTTPSVSITRTEAEPQESWGPMIAIALDK
jgi:hypothetical protein